MAKLLVTLTAIAFAACEATAGQPVSAESARALFVPLNVDGRLAHTVITKVGDVVIGDRVVSVFDLRFVNPISRHGMQQVAIVEGSRLLGVYQTEGAVIHIVGTHLRFSCSAADARDFPDACDSDAHEAIDLRSDTLPDRVLISGYLAEIRNSI